MMDWLLTFEFLRCSSAFIPLVPRFIHLASFTSLHSPRSAQTTP